MENLYVTSVGGIAVSIAAFQAVDPGSTPGHRKIIFNWCGIAECITAKKFLYSFTRILYIVQLFLRNITFTKCLKIYINIYDKINTWAKWFILTISMVKVGELNRNVFDYLKHFEWVLVTNVFSLEKMITMLSLKMLKNNISVVVNWSR